MSRETIAVDIDDVLARQNDAMREFINERYGLSLTPDDYDIEAPYWGYWNHVWGVDKEEGRARFQAFLDSGKKAELHVVEGALETLSHLKKSYDITAVTSRNDQLIDITHRWLEGHFPSMFRSVAFVHVWSSDQQVSKAIICKKIGASYLIDDNLEHCTLAAEAGLEALLFGNYGWNRASNLPSNVYRVDDWQAVRRFFDERH
jgi:5'(3')-deoxyribonucleotidase